MGNELAPQPQRQRATSRTTTVYAEPPPRQQQQQGPQHAHGGGSASPGNAAPPPPQYEEFTDWQMALFFGVIFIVLCLVLAVFFPVPTLWQYRVFKSALAISAAFVGATLPGVFKFDRGWIRFGGALLFFLLIYLVNPAGFIIHWVRPEAVIFDDLTKTYEYGVVGTDYEHEGEALRKALSDAGVKSAVIESGQRPKPYPATRTYPVYDAPIISDGDVSVLDEIDPGLVVINESTLSHYGHEKVLKALAPLRAKILIVGREYRPGSSVVDDYYETPPPVPQPPARPSYEAADERLKGRVELFAARGDYVYANVAEFKAKLREMLGKDRQALGR